MATTTMSTPQCRRRRSTTAAAAAVLSVAALCTCFPSIAAQSDRPNVIMLLAEDMGYADLASFGHPYARTPNLDKLAAEGAQFLNFHVAGATCGPSRMGLMTSRVPSSVPNFMADFGYSGLMTVTELFKEAGYRTGHIGKWHMGPNEDVRGIYGIDEIKIVGTSMRHEQGKDFEVYESAMAFVEQNADQPFYLNVWGHIAHSPVKPPQNLIDGFSDVTVDKAAFSKHMQEKLQQAEAINPNLDNSMRSYLADVGALDNQIGKLLAKLDELGLSENTIIAFLSDHGAATVNEGKQAMPENMLGYGGPYRGYKGTFLEGSLRVPHIVRWPKKIPKGMVNEGTLMSGLDWLPTVCSAANVPYDLKMYDGRDMSDVWLGSSRSRGEPLYWKKHVAEGEIAMIYDKWKLALTGPLFQREWQLYDLVEDPGEEFNLMLEDNLATLRPKDRRYVQMKLTPVLMQQMKAWNKTMPIDYCQIYAWEGCDTPLPYNPNRPPAVVETLQLPVHPDDATFRPISIPTASPIESLSPPTSAGNEPVAPDNIVPVGGVPTTTNTDIDNAPATAPTAPCRDGPGPITYVHPVSGATVTADGCDRLAPHGTAAGTAGGVILTSLCRYRLVVDDGDNDEDENELDEKAGGDTELVRDRCPLTCATCTAPPADADDGTTTADDASAPPPSPPSSGTRVSLNAFNAVICAIGLVLCGFLHL